MIATGERHSVRSFVEKTFNKLDLDMDEHVAVDARYFRPAEVEILEGDSTKARTHLGWKPEVSFDELVTMMVDSDLELAKQERALVDAGLKNIEWPSGRHE